MKFYLIIVFSVVFRGIVAQGVMGEIVHASGKLWDKDVHLETVDLSECTIQELVKQGDQFYTVHSIDNQELLGYAYSTSAQGRFEPFDYIILYDTSLTIMQVKVYRYRSNHGGAIAGKRWLKQFVGYNTGRLKYGNDIQAISGATISGISIVDDINRVQEIVGDMQVAEIN